MEDILRGVDSVRCNYCPHILEKEWLDSEWDEEKHYKIVNCWECGKKNWVKAEFEGSGHDHDLHGKGSIESMVRKVQFRDIRD